LWPIGHKVWPFDGHGKFGQLSERLEGDDFSAATGRHAGPVVRGEVDAEDAGNEAVGQAVKVAS
jgi:hypothetical protein